MKKTIIGVIVALSVCVIALVGCGASTMNAPEAAAASQELWNKAANKTTTDTITIKDLDLAGAITVKNAKAVMTRTFTGNNVEIKVAVSDLDIAIGTALDDILNTLGAFLESKNIDVKDIISKVGGISANVLVKFDLDTFTLTKLSVTTSGLKALGIIPAKNDKTWKDQELSVVLDNIALNKEDALTSEIVKLATGHMSTLFAGADGAKAGSEEAIAGVQVLTSIVPVITAAIGLVPADVDINGKLDKALGFHDITKILTEVLKVTDGKYTSTLTDGFINEQSFTAGVSLAINNAELIKIWNDVLDPMIHTPIDKFIPIVIGFLKGDGDMIVIGEFKVVSTYTINA